MDAQLAVTKGTEMKGKLLRDFFAQKRNLKAGVRAALTDLDDTIGPVQVLRVLAAALGEDEGGLLLLSEVSSLRF